MTNPMTSELIRQVAACALANATALLSEWLPDGAISGSEWVARNVARGDREPGSFGVSLETGRWNDFADSRARGGDLVSLLAYLRDCRQLVAAQEIDQRLALGLFDSPAQYSAQGAANRQAMIDEAKARTERSNAERDRVQQDAAQHAGSLWQHSRRAERLHRYLVSKQVKPYGLRQASGGRLLVPLLHGHQLVNLQTIDGDGRKRFLPGGRVKGCYSLIGDIVPDCRLYLCEGWATGATLHEHTGVPVVCAMNAGNLLPVAKVLRELYGQRIELVIAGDDDRLTAGNPGRTAATWAALECDALVVFPEWPEDAPADLSDFNDLHLWQKQYYKGPRS